MAFKRFIIAIEQSIEQTWHVAIHPEARTATAIHSRRLQRITTDKRAFPQPPSSEAANLPANFLHKQLCSTSQASDIEQVYRRIMQRSPNEDQRDMETFARYLATTLFDQTAWDRINEHAPNQPIELAFCIHPQDTNEISCLPWEMMYGNTNFLAAEIARPVAVTRLICPPNPPRAQITLPALPLPLKVLFVVGTSLDDTSIRSGAEYLGLLNHLERLDILHFQSHILYNATTRDISQAIATWHPSVVHFICHGDHDENGGYLQLTPLDSQQSNMFYAPELLPLLLSTNIAHAAPPIVVLNTCYSAASLLHSTSLATDLINGGIPLVVAMTGRIANKACQYFTTSFYEALLTGKSLVAATAEGRLAGFVNMSGHQSGVDWIFPALFMAEGISPTLAIEQTSKDRWSTLRHIARNYRGFKDDTKHGLLPFYDRLTFITTYQELMRPDNGGNGINALAVIAPAPANGSLTRSRYGKTRLLNEIAAHAALDGHIPCLPTVSFQNAPPASALDLADQILQTIRKTYSMFGLPEPRDAENALAYDYLLLNASTTDPTASKRLTTLTRDALQTHRQQIDHPEVLASALYADLKNLALRAREYNRYARVVLLLDDVHRFGITPARTSACDLLISLLYIACGPQSDNLANIILTFSNTTTGEYAEAVINLKQFIENVNGWLPLLHLDAFPGPNDPLPIHQSALQPTEYHLIYQQFLLSLNLMVTDSAEKTAYVYKRLHEVTQGIPSRFKLENSTIQDEKLKEVIYSIQELETELKQTFFEPVDDQAWLATGDDKVRLPAPQEIQRI